MSARCHSCDRPLATQADYDTTPDGEGAHLCWRAAVAPRQRVFTDHRGGVAPEADRQHIAANSPQVTLALVQRIRALEAFAASLIHDHVPHTDEAEMYAFLEKGVVLP